MEIKKFSLPVEGMTCASCVARVEKALLKVEGVQKVAVNLATEKANFELDTSKADLKKVAEIVEDAGYKMTLPASSLEKSQSEENVTTPAENDYYSLLKKDFVFAAVLTLPVFIISMSMEFSWFHKFLAPQTTHAVMMETINKILLILTTPIVFISGKRFFRIFWNNLKHFSADMNSLVAIGTGTAYLYSLSATLFPVLFSGGEAVPAVYFDSTAVIITLILMGRWLESRAKKKTGESIKKLLNLRPRTANVLRQGKEVTINAEDLLIRDIVIVRPGEKIPADGIITEGYSAIDESMITGESIPVEKNAGAKVIGGTINKNGNFEFEVAALGTNSVLGQIIRLVEEAQGSKAPIQKLADKIAAVFVPVVVVIAIITFIGWLVLGSTSSFNLALINFVSVLIIACPCALGLATPTAIMVGTGLGANHGILIKNGESLEEAHKITTVILDKTGTITEGKPEVANIATDGISEDELLRAVASVENKSEHPLASAIIEYSKLKGLSFLKVESFQSITGRGITAITDGAAVVIGNEKMMSDYAIKTDKFKSLYEEYSAEGKTVIFTAINGELKGLLAVEDPIKTTSKKAIDEFRKMNIKVVMLTGDNKTTAGAIAKRLGIELYSAEILPEQKAEEVRKYQQQGEVVAMVGDGINDAPALAQSDVAVAMGSGTDVAIETSDITLLKSDLATVINSIKLSRQTIKTIRQNLFWAFIYNVLGIPLAAIGMLNPMFAALAMSFSSVSVVSNSLRLRRVKLG